VDRKEGYEMSARGIGTSQVTISQHHQQAIIYSSNTKENKDAI
jgi:hypothetical protein